MTRRPPSVETTRAGEAAEVTFDLLQEAKARRASGVFRLTDPRSKVAIDMKEFGSLQTMGGWASFTGGARLRPSEAERSVMVILDDDELVVSAGDYQLDGSFRQFAVRSPAARGREVLKAF